LGLLAAERDLLEGIQGIGDRQGGADQFQVGLALQARFNPSMTIGCDSQTCTVIISTRVLSTFIGALAG
jgi:hypothetical protein